MKNLFLAAALLSSLSSCGGGAKISDEPDMPEPATPIELTKAEGEILDSTNGFGLKLFQDIWQRDKGTPLFISPLSASLCLSMTAGGAADETLQQMQQTLGVSGYSISEMGGYYRKMTSALLEIDSATTFETANAIWANNDISLKAEYIKFANDYYSAQINSDNLGLQSTVDKINKWCADNTHDKIRSILDEPIPDLKMILLNALYFKGTWQFKFANTNKQKFTTYDGKSVEVDMMNYDGSLRAGTHGSFKAVSLPYGNGAFSMLVILPEGGKSLDEAIAALDAGTLKALSNSMYEREVVLSLPKFKMEYERSLKDPLIALGMSRALSGAAQFPGISESSLMISDVKQKTYVDVNEQGTEAAAVTAAFMKLTSVANPPEPFTFNANRPFIFAIREVSTGALLFIGAKVK